MKLLINILLLAGFLIVGNVKAQTFGNEWIDYSQIYYKFKIVNTGIYRIDYNTLQAAGVPLGTFEPANMQIFGKQREVPLHVVDGNDSSFDSLDYFIFYAERNDGWLDSVLYDDPNTIGNPMYSLYNDTLVYFFTWNDQTNNLRYTVETDVNFENYSDTADFIINTVEANRNTNYFEGEKVSDASSSRYTPGEGWSNGLKNGVVGNFTPVLLNVSTPLPYSGPGSFNPVFRATAGSGSDAAANSNLNHHLLWEIAASGYDLNDTIFDGYQQIITDTEFPITELTNGTTQVKWSIINDLGALTDWQTFSYYSIKYPRIPDLQNQNNHIFNIPNNTTGQGKVHLVLKNVAFNKPVMLVHGDVPRMVKLVNNSPNYEVLIPNSSNGVEQTVIFKDTNLILNVSSLIPVNGTGTFRNFLNENLDEALIFVYNNKLIEGVSEYYNYRVSPAGGSYNVLLAEVDELYLQFGGGIEKHILGIKRFLNLIYDNTTTKPVGLYIIGKGIREGSYFSPTTALVQNTPARKNVGVFHSSLVPSFGFPASDNMISAGFEGTKKYVPLIPTGRIAVRNSDQLLDYLEKVQLYEQEQIQTSAYSTETKDWQKHIIHFGGGKDQTERDIFQAYLNNWENIIEDTIFGGEVLRVYKESSDPLGPDLLDITTDRIQNGVSLISYFGHSSTTTSGFEINLDEPQFWNNYGKYPVMLVNSCFNGDIFSQDTRKSEQFVLAEDYGAVAYIASETSGFSNYLSNYSGNLYRQFAYKNYGQNLGTQIQQNVNEIEGSNVSLYTEVTITQMVLHGDPMLKLNWHEKPEFEIVEERVWFDPPTVDLTVDSVEVFVEVRNLGRGTADTLLVEIRRDFPGSAVDSVYTKQLFGLSYKDTVSVKMPIQSGIGMGINNFEISVDIPSFIDEQYDEMGNNQLVKPFYIEVDGIVPVIPYEFAVVPDDSVTVKASTVNPIADFNTYRFEIDTIDFEGLPSPAHRFALVSGLGGVKEVNPSEWTLTSNPSGDGTLVCEDSVVYFWRVSVEGDTNFMESSFQYIEGREGWGQDHFYQFKKNDFFTIDYDRQNRLRKFIPGFSRELECNVYSAGGVYLYYNDWLIDGVEQEYGTCSTSPLFQVAVIDPADLEAWGTRWWDAANSVWINPDHNFGNNNDNAGCVNRVMHYFTFHQNDPVRMDSFESMVLNHVPDSFYILIYSRYASYNLWDAGVFNTFDMLGSDSIYVGRPNSGFAFFCQKGDTNSVQELYIPTTGGSIKLIVDIDIQPGTGVEVSPLIGPSALWGNLYWKQDSLEIPSADTTVLTINLYNSSGNYMSNMSIPFTHDDSLMNLNSFIDAAVYPYIQLRAEYEDTLDLSPAQIDRWHVLYQPLPEAAVDGSTSYLWSVSGDTLTEGQNIEFAVDVKNIFSVDMDSLLINYWVEDANQVKHYISYARQDSLLVGETLRDTITISTVGLGGVNSLWMEVNPYVNGSLVITDQPEQFHFNNVLQKTFYVLEDEINPILDVTFNGTHILNGDIISPESEIVITLKDENEFLIMNEASDTSAFAVYLTDPAGVQKRIYFTDGSGNTIMQWIPADAQNKRFKIIWNEDFELDGKHTLLVQGTDKSGNISGDFEYRITFEIIHESTITHVMNYPNPFSTRTNFVFTLTGSEVPDEIIIQIMTVTGKVVREITEDEIGPLQIGRNITEFAWDGSDEFGDPLANGVYLYRVLAQIGGKDIKLRESGADQYFKKEFGKMYLLR